MAYVMYILSIVAGFLLLKFLNQQRKSNYRLPPGPLKLPIVGYLPWLDPKEPHESLTRITEKYGRICGLWMGSVYTVLLSDPRVIRQTLAKASASGRAPLYLTHGIMQGYGLICAEGERWKEQRRFVASCLNNFGMVKQGDDRRDRLESSITKFATEAINSLKEARGEAIDPSDIFHHCIGNFMNKLVFGKVYEKNDETWMWMQYIQEEGVKHLGVAGLLNFLPFLRFLPHYKHVIGLMKNGQAKTHGEYAKIIEVYRARRTLGKYREESFVASFVEEINNRKLTGNLGSFTEMQFHHLLADLFGAGVDTTFTTFRWFILFMVAYPQEQKKIYEEMRQVLGDREPKLEDRSRLVRLEAAIAEVQRMRSVVPVGIPHGTTEDTKIGDYLVPKGTMVVPLQWAIHMDPEYWENPHTFNPDRFITEEGTLAKPEAFLPFQTGKRMCVGDELAKMLLFIFAGHVLWNFDISPNPSEEITLVGDCGITLVPKTHRFIFSTRSEL